MRAEAKGKERFSFPEVSVEAVTQITLWTMFFPSGGHSRGGVSGSSDSFLWLLMAQRVGALLFLGSLLYLRDFNFFLNLLCL